MKEEDKQLLLKDLCSRLPYGVMCKLSAKSANVSITEKLETGGLEHFIFGTMDVKPYLRPMSSMNEEERGEYLKECMKVFSMRYAPSSHYQVVDWLNTHHIDYRRLIESGLALEAPPEMYKTE